MVMKTALMTPRDPAEWPSRSEVLQWLDCVETPHCPGISVRHWHSDLQVSYTPQHCNSNDRPKQHLLAMLIVL